MSAAETVVALAIAAIALYGLGIPLAWLFPAPLASPWLYRIAIAPLFAIVLTTLAAGVLSALGIALHPLQLLLIIVASWAWVTWRRRKQWSRPSAGDLALPATLIGGSAVVWFLSLVGYGLYLPNRDFKNHAYLVAQIAWTRTSDIAQVWRNSPVSEPSSPGSFYPIGLHTLLGWAVPTMSSNTVGVTAAAAVLVAAISGPLAFVVLARMWAPLSEYLPWAAGAAAIAMPGLSEPFRIGSVVLVVGAVLYAAALSSLWLWRERPTLSTTVALGLVGLGLFFLHVAEAAGLALVACVVAPGMLRGSGGRARWLWAAPAGLAVLTAVLLGTGSVQRLSGILESGFKWDIQVNNEGWPTAFLMALIQQPGGMPALALAWITFGLVGFWIAHRSRMSAFPLFAFIVPVALGTLSVARGTPALLNLVTAPWYGSASRVGLMAAAPLALAGCLTLIRAVEQGPAQGIRVVAGLVVVSCLAGLAVQIVPSRRQSLSTSLAGAGDTADVATGLAATLRPGGTVLNLEGDGTANLFAFARIPVLSGLALDAAADGPESDGPLTHQLLRLADPAVAQRLAELDVEFIALGTTSRYWDVGIGYDWRDVLAQPEVRLELMGSDMVILRYLGGQG